MRKSEGTLVHIDTPQGRRTVGRLVNNILHIDRDYNKHHLHKFKGWAMAVEIFDQHPSIRGIRINATNAPNPKAGPNATADRIYLFSFDEAGVEPGDLETKNFGHGEQAFIPDKQWEVLDTNGFLRTEKPAPVSADTEISPSPPDPFVVDDKQPKFDDQQKSHPFILSEIKVTTPSYRTFGHDTAFALLDAGYTIHLFQMQQGLMLWKQGDNYVLKVPGVHMDIHVDFSDFSERMKDKQHTLDF